MRQPEFNFVPLKQDLPKNPTMRISIDKTNGMVRFLKDKWCPALTEELSGQFVKFYHDGEKKVIAFRFFDEGSLAELKDYKKVKMTYPSTGGTVVSVNDMTITKFLSKDKKYLNIEVKSWKSTSAFDFGSLYYYFNI